MINRCLIIFSVIMAMAVSPVRAEGQLWKFQFGPTNAPKFSDFVLVSPVDQYNQAVGYGWITNARLQASTAKEPLGDDLARSCVYSKPVHRGPAYALDFCLDVPDGQYEVFFWMGRQGHYVFPARSFDVTAEGETVCRENIVDATNFYHSYFAPSCGVDLNPGDSLWKTYIAPHFPLRHFAVTVKDGQLNLSWKSEKINHSSDNWCAICSVRGMMVYSADNKEAAEQELRQIDRMRQKGYDGCWTEVIKEKDPPDVYAPNKEDTERGYVLFSRHYMDNIYPRTKPRTTEVTGELKVFMTPGEYEPVALGVYPLTDLKKARVTVGDLASKDGNVLPKEAVRVELLIYNVEERRRTAEYTIIPQYGMVRPEFDIRLGTTKGYLLIIKAPEDAKPGLYQGKVTFSAEGKPVRELALKVKILPFHLMPLEGHSISFQWHTRLWYVAQQYPVSDEVYWAAVEKQLIDQLEMGCNAAPWGTPGPFQGITVKDGRAEGRWTTAGNKVEDTEKYYQMCGRILPTNSYAVVSLYRQFGCGTKINKKNDSYFLNIGPYQYPSEEWKIATRYMLASFDGMIRRNGLRPIFYTAGEVSNGGLPGIRAVEEMMKTFLNTLPGYEYAGMMNGSSEVKILAPYFNIVGMNYGVPLNEEYISYVKSLGKTLFNYQAHDRFGYGFYYWRIGAKGTITEYYNQSLGDQFNQLDDSYPHYDEGVVKIGPDLEIYHLLRYYKCREGIDDAKYLNTLSHLIEQARKSGDAQRIALADTAQKTLDEIMNGINYDITWYMRGNRWRAEDYDSNRWKIAQEIINLRE